jgi:hypothetical protein
MTTWHCVKHCGACCHLDPADRPDLDQYLAPAELAQYLDMVGEDGWCVYFDHQTRLCTIYEQRPRFCRVCPTNFEQMYDVAADEFHEFAIACCEEQIAGVYGEESAEFSHFEQEIYAATVDLPGRVADNENNMKSSPSTASDL